ncbi:MAG: EAL domain-containing protein [Betaproteobacteria bacterium]|nr:EAL domain-containing protein [Betaproteobacteria bacterium]
MAYLQLIPILFAGALLLIALALLRRTLRAERGLHREKERAQVTLHSIADGVITTDPRGIVEYLNPVAESLTGWSAREAEGMPLSMVYTVMDEHTRQPLAGLEWAIEGGGASKERKRLVRLVNRSGREIPVEDSLSPLRDAAGEVMGTVVVFRDVSRIQAMAQQLSWQASHDALTGLVNRREFERMLGELLETIRTQDKRHALLYLDLDDFKAVNDSCGHLAGDELLRQLASAMQIKIRGSDTLARLGGDEFGVLLEACPLEQAIRIANNLLETVRDFRFDWQGKSLSVGVSIGLVPLDSSSGYPEQVLAAADASCYAAKGKGRNRLEVYHSEESRRDSREGELQLLTAIHEAFEKGSFRLFQQQILPLAAGREAHHEILVRMVDSAGQLLSPTAFLPTAERYKLQSLLDRWVITTLLEFLRRHAGAEGGRGETCFAINLSGGSINDSTFADFLRREIGEHHVNASRLCFEITETTAISNLTKAAELMHEMKALGCRFALDDFGIGMSSFAYLKHLPVDFLKIDGAFVRDMARNPMDAAIVEAINRIAHALGIETVAEYVEDGETLAKVRELGVDYAQGDAVGGPEPLQVPAGAATRPAA